MATFLRYAQFIIILCILDAYFAALPHSFLRPYFLYMGSCFLSFWHNETATFLFALLLGCLAFFLGYPTYVVFLYPMISLILCRFCREESRLLARAFYSSFLLLLSSLVRLLAITLITNANTFSFIPVLIFETFLCFFTFFLINLLSHITQLQQRKIT